MRGVLRGLKGHIPGSYYSRERGRHFGGSRQIRMPFRLGFPLAGASDDMADVLRVLVIDDHEMFSEALACYLGERPASSWFRRARMP